MNRILWALHFLAGFVLIPALASGYELRPGRVRDPAGIQLFQTAVYNPELDSYLLLYEDGRALVGHLSPGGVFSGEAAISGNIGVTHVAAAYNPEDGTFLAVYRDGEPPEIYGRYLTGNGMPIGNSFFIGPGGAPHVAFSPESGRYVVTWEQLTSGFVRYRVINGNSTSGTPHVTAMSSVGGGLSDAIAYGSGPDKFLVVYVREAPGSKANVYGKFISANGQSVGPEFVVAGGTESQGVPRVAYAPTTDRFMVIWENWASCSGGCPHIRGALVASNGSVVKTFNVAVTAGWDQPGPIGYSSATNTFVTGWRSAYSDTRIEARAGEFSPVDGSLVRPTVLISDLNVGVEGLALRPDRTNPQAMFLTRLGFGGDGVHAGIVNLRGGGPGPGPDDDPPAAVDDLRGRALTGAGAVTARAIASTNAGTSGTEMAKTVDNRPGSFWSSPLRSGVVSEFITWDLGAPKKLSQVSLLARTPAAFLFPLDYQIQVSSNNTTFTTVFSVTGAPITRGAWVHHTLPEPTARYVKLLITKSRRVSGKYRAQLAEVEFVEANEGASVMLEWTAPGDDGNTGTASAYDLRWSPNAITAANFGSASALPGRTPAHAGTKESRTFSGFPRESRVYFAMKARDEASNVSLLSNVISVPTPGAPPAAVQGFTATIAAGNSANLTWQPSGDDGNVGNATSYDIRRSTAPITDANFRTAVSVIRPATSPKPAIERYTVTGLASQKTYYFAIKAIDELGNVSLINGGGPVTVRTSDAFPPAAVTNLAVTGRNATKLTATAIAASSQATIAEARTKVTDGSLTSYWSSLGSPVERDEFITLDLGALQSIEKVDILARPAGFLFPRDLVVQVSRDNANWSIVGRGVELPATQGMRHTFEFPTALARYVRILITKTRSSGGGVYYAQIAEIEVSRAVTSFLLNLAWTEPGDDGRVGSAASYDVRYSRLPITTEAQFANATAINGEPAPTRAGNRASFNFDPPVERVTLHFRMRAFDASGNASPLSNQASAFVAVVAPNAVSDLTAQNPAPNSVDLAWTTTGDDQHSGTLTSLDVRYSASPIHAGNFYVATEVPNEPTPAAPGTRQQMTVSGLSPSTTYHFAMCVLDESGTPSSLSNVATIATGAPDETAPSDVTDLRGSLPFSGIRVPAPAIAASSVESGTAGFAKATDGISTSYWGSFGRKTPSTEWITLDTGSQQSIGEVKIWSRPAGALFPEELEIQLSADNLSFATVHRATGLSAAQGMLHRLTFPAASGRFVRVFVTKPRRSAGGAYAAQIGEIQVFGATFVPGPVTLNWTAPGDDGPSGSAASYDLRYSRSPIMNVADFAAATPVAGAPVPQAAGAIESMVVSLPQGTYHFALRAMDDSGNQSGLSNVFTIAVP